jgi:hypothetical protein
MAQEDDDVFGEAVVQHQRPPTREVVATQADENLPKGTPNACRWRRLRGTDSERARVFDRNAEQTLGIEQKNFPLRCLAVRQQIFSFKS